MSDEERSIAERVDQHRADYEENIRGLAASGEPLNVLLSSEVRESLEMYLKQSAEVLAECDHSRPALLDMVTYTAADALPHVTKGAVRETLREYLAGAKTERNRQQAFEEMNNDAR